MTNDPTLIPATSATPKVTLKQMLLPLLGVGGIASGGTFTAVHEMIVEPYVQQIEILQADKQKLEANYTGMLCEWAFMHKCHGSPISTNVGNGVCRDVLEREECPE